MYMYLILSVGKSTARAAKTKGQLSIMTMFESMTSKRKSLGGEATSEKKLKMEPLNE
mgnify:CR=1 FL=1